MNANMSDNGEPICLRPMKVACDQAAKIIGDSGEASTPELMPGDTQGLVPAPTRSNGTCGGGARSEGARSQ